VPEAQRKLAGGETTGLTTQENICPGGATEPDGLLQPFAIFGKMPTAAPPSSGPGPELPRKGFYATDLIDESKLLGKKIDHPNQDCF